MFSLNAGEREKFGDGPVSNQKEDTVKFRK